ncbi:predicted protein [Naegleria gruberi]|uniref:Predicted protein n=1 Tax=Naegleria gruberi TaxID=5762 RepID=D2VES9_NAEGR|nr:uncharacterized protein NAEGRDRAFT_67380 [Naegleria gruberi]EFC44559.1 predicted protein [Naegleria gruberi]|eukprot:XP_002677303.1 predicted protein [Naegleria gruberi strain NEG-M]
MSQSPQNLDEFVQIIRNSNATMRLAVTTTLKPWVESYGYLYGFDSIRKQVNYEDLTPVSDCIKSDNMIENDGFIGTASSISSAVKAHKMIYPERKSELELRNFYSLRYIPKSLVVASSVSMEQNVEFLSNIIDNNIGYLNASSQCGTPQVLSRDAAWARYGFSFVNFTVTDIRNVERMYNISINFDNRYANTVIEKYRNYVYFNESMSSVLKQMSDSSCMQCPYELCYAFGSQDYASYIGVGIAIFYFILLFSLGMFRSYSLKRRLFVPYLPLFGILRNFSNTQMLSASCQSVSRPMALFASIVIIAVYFFTIMRYVYMRNMYSFLSNSNKSTAFHKRILSIPFALSMSLAFILVLSIIVVLPPTVAFEIFNDNNIINGVGAGVIFLSLISSVSFLMVDLFLNRNNIKRYGILKFLFFDDPIYLRIDIAFQAMILIFLILYISVSFVETIFPAIMDVCISISVILICGGNAMIIEISKKIIYKDRTAQTQQSDLENLMEKNKEFYTLMSEYSRKEFSYENVAFYDAILDYKSSRKSLSLDDLKRIETEFIHPFSKYEVNLPSQVKKDLSSLIQDLSVPSNQSDHETKIKTRKHQLIETMFLELCKNLTDTFHRLKQTQQYSQWLAVYQLQKENSLNV